MGILIRRSERQKGSHTTQRGARPKRGRFGMPLRCARCFGRASFLNQTQFELTARDDGSWWKTRVFARLHRKQKNTATRNHLGVYA